MTINASRIYEYLIAFHVHLFCVSSLDFICEMIAWVWGLAINIWNAFSPFQNLDQFDSLVRKCKRATERMREKTECLWHAVWWVTLPAIWMGCAFLRWLPAQWADLNATKHYHHHHRHRNYYYCYYFNGCCYLSLAGINTRSNVSNYKTIHLKSQHIEMYLMEVRWSKICAKKEENVKQIQTEWKESFECIYLTTSLSLSAFEWLNLSDTVFSHFPLIFDMLHTCSVNFI